MRRDGFYYSQILTDTCRWNKGNRKSLLGKHHITAIAGKSHRWMLKLIGKNMIRNRIFASFQNISSQDTY